MNVSCYTIPNMCAAELEFCSTGPVGVWRCGTTGLLWFKPIATHVFIKVFPRIPNISRVIWALDGCFHAHRSELIHELHFSDVWVRIAWISASTRLYPAVFIMIIFALRTRRMLKICQKFTRTILLPKTSLSHRIEPWTLKNPPKDRGFSRPVTDRPGRHQWGGFRWVLTSFGIHCEMYRTFYDPLKHVRAKSYTCNVWHARNRASQ